MSECREDAIPAGSGVKWAVHGNLNAAVASGSFKATTEHPPGDTRDAAYGGDEDFRENLILEEDARALSLYSLLTEHRNE